MNGFLTILSAGIASFIATNLDDILILILFFSRANERFRHRHIIAGQYLGFTALIIASLPGLFGNFFIPKAYLGLLGILPIVVGVRQWLTQEEDEQEVQGIMPSGDRKLFFGSFLTKILSLKTYNVAAVTVANGGDNIGIYVPLFASSSWLSFGIILSVFYVMIGIWCWTAYLLTRHPLVAQLLTRYGNIAVPFILVSLGLFILLESGSFKLLSCL